MSLKKPLQPEDAAGSRQQRGLFNATVEHNRSICREHYELRLRFAAGFPATQPGQFIQINCRPPNGANDPDAVLGTAHDWCADHRFKPRQAEVCHPLALLRRPFSIAGRGDDVDGSWLDIIHRVVGVGTAWMAALQEGDPVDVIGPLGNRFTLPQGKRNALLVGGGVGLPPMFYLAQAAQIAGWQAVGFVGALSQDLLAVGWEPGASPDTQGTPTLSISEFARHGFRSVVTTDDGSLGLQGRITEGLEKYLDGLDKQGLSQSVVYVCGPHPMMHAVAKIADRYGVDCQACLEQAMACGMGTCQSCVVKIEEHTDPHGNTQQGRPWRYRLACTDGPVFSAADVLW